MYNFVNWYNITVNLKAVERKIIDMVLIIGIKDINLKRYNGNCLIYFGLYGHLKSLYDFKKYFMTHVLGVELVPV